MSKWDSLYHIDILLHLLENKEKIDDEVYTDIISAARDHREKLRVEVLKEVERRYG